MKTLRYMAAALAAAGLMAAPANAATFVFKGNGNNVVPTNTADYTCASSETPVDICNVEVDGVWQSLDYTKDGIDVSVNGYTYGDATRLIQDRNPKGSGIGVWSEFGDPGADQTQANAGESIEFIFDSMVRVTNVEFNAGSDQDCSAVTPTTVEGYCGAFQLDVFDSSDALLLSTIYDVTNVDILAQLGTAGVRFVLTALTPKAGFAIGQFTVNEVPVPAALPLLLSGLAGLGFASRRRKAA